MKAEITIIVVSSDRIKEALEVAEKIQSSYPEASIRFEITFK